MLNVFSVIISFSVYVHIVISCCLLINVSQISFIESKWTQENNHKQIDRFKGGYKRSVDPLLAWCLEN